MASVRTAQKTLLKHLLYCCVTWISLGLRRERHSCATIYGHFLATAVVYRIITYQWVYMLLYVYLTTDFSLFVMFSDASSIIRE
jgi:hypothetical protein